MISLNIEKTFGFISKESISAYEAKVKEAQEALENGTCKGSDFLGWLHLPSSITKEHLDDLKATAQVLRDNCEVVVVAGTSVHAPSSKPCPTASYGCRKRKMRLPSFLPDTTSARIIYMN